MKCINCQSPMIRNDESEVVEFECSNLDCATFYYPYCDDCKQYGHEAGTSDCPWEVGG